MEEKSITKKVKEYVEKNYFIKEALSLGIVNFSKLTRIISENIKDASFQAIHIALRRISENAVKLKEKTLRKVQQLLKKSRITMVSGIISVKLEKNYTNTQIAQSLNEKSLATINLTDLISIIIDKDYINHFKNAIEINKNLTAIIIKSPKHLHIKGYIAFISNLIASENINIIDFITSYDEMIIILSDEDAPKVYKILVKLTK